MGIFRKIYQKIFNSNMQDYNRENEIFENLENDLKQKSSSIEEMVKLAISAIKKVINIRSELKDIPQKGLGSLYSNLKETDNLYDQVKILSKGTGTGWGSMWNSNLREIFNKELLKMYSNDDTPVQPTLKSPIKEHDEKNKEKVSLSKSKEERIAEIKKDLNNRKLKQDAINEIIKAAEYLFENGYGDKDLHFLGKGGFNVVFRIGSSDRVVKYCKSKKDKNVSFDEEPLKEFEKMVQGIKDSELKKWSDKYLSKSTRVNKKNIYEDKLANGDLFNITANKRYKVLSNNLKKTKSLDSLLKKAKNAAKSILVLHKSGYVHQDIKPENILHLSNPKYFKAIQQGVNGQKGKDTYGEYTVISEKSEKDNKTRYFKKYESGKKRKISKNTINLADYGLMRKIKDEISKVQTAGTRTFEGLDDMKSLAGSGEDVMKRDVYALGMTFAVLMCASFFGIKSGANDGKQWGEYVKLTLNGTDEQNFRKFETWYKDYKPTGERTLSNLYGDNEEMRVFHFVKLINDMTGPRKNRPLMGDVIAKISEIEYLKKD